MHLQKATDETYRRAKKLYNEAFPLNERMPFFLLKRKAEEYKAEFWDVYDRDLWVGIAYIIRHEDLAYLYYLAVDEVLRNRGYGTKIIGLLKEQYDRCRIFLCLEQPDEKAANNKQRQERHHFYEQCGLVDLPGMIQEGPVVFAVMGTEYFVPSGYEELMEKYIGKVLKKIVPLRYIA
jgi:GNAT superfamily N-acetyltransferase